MSACLAGSLCESVHFTIRASLALFCWMGKNGILLAVESYLVERLRQPQLYNNNRWSFLPCCTQLKRSPTLLLHSKEWGKLNPFSSSSTWHHHHGWRNRWRPYFSLLGLVRRRGRFAVATLKLMHLSWVGWDGLVSFLLTMSVCYGRPQSFVERFLNGHLTVSSHNFTDRIYTLIGRVVKPTIHSKHKLRF